jgi:hypothetical protein
MGAEPASCLGEAAVFRLASVHEGTELSQCLENWPTFAYRLLH